MLSMSELAMNPNRKVTTKCYGEVKVWNDREEAQAYFLEAMMNSDGAEHDRYSGIYIQLQNGLDYCTDEDDDEEDELNEYFSSDHSIVISETSKEVIASLSESRDRFSGKLCYTFNYNQRRYRYTLLRFADMIVRADVTAKKLKSRIMELDAENRELRKQLADMERKMKR